MALYAVVHSFQTDEPRFAVVADDSTARYVFVPGREMQGLDDKRIERLVQRRKARTPITDETLWLRLAMTNVGYFYAKAPSEAPSIEEAATKALEALGAAG